jgi:ABC-type phosphate transport system substrate-binding protein
MRPIALARVLRRLGSAFVMALVLACLGRPAAAQKEGFVVVVSVANSMSSISRIQLSKIFLKRTTTWDGQSIVPLDLNATSPSRDAFSRAVHQKPVDAVRAFWQQQIFSGRDTPPVEKPSDAEVLETIRSTPNAIGYVSPSAALGRGVKAVRILP